MASKKAVRIGGASGYWGDAAMATAQLLNAGDLDFIVYDYLAEITMAILARMRARDANAGYAQDFVSAAMAPNLAEITKQGVRIISNAGGINPDAAAKALRAEITRQGLDLSVAVVTGDDLMADLGAISDQAPVDMFSGRPLPEVAKIASVNAYLGAFPIATALDRGADIVLTGRCVDSAVTLGAAIHHFGWSPHDLDQLSGGALAGHIIECGPQATGGNFTDWAEVAETLDTIGYPIVEIEMTGNFTVSKPKGTGGKVSIGTVAEQMLYEIGDPSHYLLPDIDCDFTGVEIANKGPDLVEVSGARGQGVRKHYKTCLTFEDGYRGGHLFSFYGLDAEAKAAAFAKAAFARSRRILRQMNAPDFTETSVELIGAESQFGAGRKSPPSRELAAKIAVKHPDPKGVGLFLKEATGLGLATPPGLSGFAGARPKPSPVMALFSYLTPKADVQVEISDAAGRVTYVAEHVPNKPATAAPPEPNPPRAQGEIVAVPLIRLAFARSGDKGDSANIGVIARHADYLPWIWAALDVARIERVFSHFLKGDVQRFVLPGSHAMNILMSGVLGGGGTSSLRNDPQGKGYAQILLAETIEIDASLLKDQT